MANTKPGERKLQILQALAAMLEQPKGDRITTAALAARLDVSEAALYRHFASKAQMFEGLIEFIETSVFGLINKISDGEENGVRQVRSIAGMLLADDGFCDGPLASLCERWISVATDRGCCTTASHACSLRGVVFIVV